MKIEKNLYTRFFFVKLILFLLILDCTVYHSVTFRNNDENELKDAKELFKEGDHWHAAFAFGKLNKNTRNNQIGAQSALLLGHCFDSLSLFNNAKKVYESAIHSYGETEYINAFNDAISSVDYKLGLYDSVCLRYEYFQTVNGMQSHFAKLITANALFQLNKFKESIELVAKIDTTNEIQCKAKMLAGLCYLAQKDTIRAKSEFEISVMACSSEVPNACLQLGLLQIGEKVVNVFHQINKNSALYENAIVEICWEYMRHEKPDSIIVFVDDFMNNYSKSPYIAELLLLKGYAHMLLKNRREAINVLEKILVILDDDWANDSVATLKSIDSLELIVKSFGDNNTNILKSVYTKISDSALVQLHTNYNEYIKQISLLEFVKDKLGKIKLFSLKKDNIQTDVEYALAKPSPLCRECKSPDNLSDKNEQLKIDEELEELKKQLEASQ